MSRNHHSFKSKADPNSAIEGYLRTLEALLSKTRKGPDKQDARSAWVALRDARIFSVESRLGNLFLDAWGDAAGDGEPLPDPDWPEMFPFENVWLGFDGSSFYAEFDQVGDASLIGILMTISGDGWMVFTESGEIHFFRIHSRETGWSDETIFYEELGPLIIEYVNQQRTFLIAEEVPDLRRRMKMNRKSLGVGGKKFLPPPFYRLRVRSRVIKELAQRKADGMPPNYRHDVRGHERCSLRRGPLPLSPKQREKLEAAEYRIFTLGALDAETLVRLMQREIRPKSPTEWLAIKVTWIESHISPSDESLPYVPALRELRR